MSANSRARAVQVTRCAEKERCFRRPLSSGLGVYRPRRARRFAAVLALLVVSAAAVLAEAHAKLARSTPPAASTLRAAPPEVKLWFTESLEASFSAAHLLDGERRRVDGAEGRVDAMNRALLRMTLPVISPGRYTVVYRVVSVDSHVTAGELTFRIVR
jgi:methionine-rich copper-binding protein CopC